MTNTERRKGAILVLAAFLLIVMFGFVAFTVDVGYISLTKTQLHTAVDAAALAGAAALLETPESARSIAVDAAARNSVAGRDMAIDANENIEFGTWDTETKTFVTLPLDEILQADAVRVTGRLSNADGSGVNLFFAPIIGHRTAELEITSIATIGTAQPRDIMLVIDCSGSMADYNRMEYTREAAQLLCDEIMDTDRVGLAVYSYPWELESVLEIASSFLRNLLMSILWNSEDITGFLEETLTFEHDGVRSRCGSLTDGLYANRTNIAGGMRVGLEELANNEREDDWERENVKKYLVLMTDGHANVAEPPSNSPTGSMMNYAAQALSQGVIIHGITLGSGADGETISQIAHMTGGDYYHVEDGDFAGLFEAYRRIGRGDGKAKLVQ